MGDSTRQHFREVVGEVFGEVHFGEVVGEVVGEVHFGEVVGEVVGDVVGEVVGEVHFGEVVVAERKKRNWDSPSKMLLLKLVMQKKR